MLVENINCVTRTGQLLAAHRTGRSPADDRNVCHLDIFLTASNFRRRVAEPVKRLSPSYVIGKTTTQKPARSIAPKIAAASGDPVPFRTTSIPVRWNRQNTAK